MPSCVFLLVRLLPLFIFRLFISNKDDQLGFKETNGNDFLFDHFHLMISDSEIDVDAEVHVLLLLLRRRSFLLEGRV